MNKNKKLIIIILLLVAVLSMVTLLYTYAKFTTRVTGSAQAHIANVICVMSTPTVTSGENVVNPYCTFSVSNFSGTDVSETALNFEIAVTSTTQEFTLPDYYWTDGSGNVIRDSSNQIIESAPLTGTFTNGATGTTQTYRCVFKNTGDADISNANINLSLTATQAN